MNVPADSMTNGLLRYFFLEWPLLYAVPAILIVFALVATAYYKGGGVLGQKKWVPISLVIAAVVVHVVVRSLPIW